MTISHSGLLFVGHPVYLLASDGIHDHQSTHLFFATTKPSHLQYIGQRVSIATISAAIKSLDYGQRLLFLSYLLLLSL